MGKKKNRYDEIIEKIFFDHFKEGEAEFFFEREELVSAAELLNIKIPKNIGDIIYYYRFRNPFPESMVETQSDGKEWVIELAGPGRYRFKLGVINRVIPNENLIKIKIPDSTPEMINCYAKTDEQALLARVRYNRLIDVFLRVTSHSLQNHLRTSVKGVGQIEIDELYVGVRNTGQQFIIPVQAKGGNDKIGATQVWQDLMYCSEAYPDLTPRAVAVQFCEGDVIAMFELAFQGEELRVVDEKHYLLVLGNDISRDELKQMVVVSD